MAAPPQDFERREEILPTLEAKSKEEKSPRIYVHDLHQHRIKGNFNLFKPFDLFPYYGIILNSWDQFHNSCIKHYILLTKVF